MGTFDAYSWFGVLCDFFEDRIKTDQDTALYFSGFICGCDKAIEYNSEYIVVNAFETDSFTYDEANNYCYENFDSNLGTMVDYYDNQNYINYNSGLFNDMKQLFLQVSTRQRWIGIKYD